LQEVGEVTCTLGEVKNRADVVLFWNSDPVTTHPRHLERYAGDPVGRFVPQGRAGRTIIVVDHKRTATADLADHFFEVSGEESWEMLWRLRLLVRGGPVAAAPEWVALAERLKLAQCGILFFGKGLTEGPMGHRHVAALLELVTDLNRYTRFYARRMRRYGDVAGADSVLAWQTGYPFGVDFSRGYPRYNPGEFTGVDRLSRAEVDAALILSRETVADLPWPARDTLQRIPTILLDPFPVPPEADWRPTVHNPTALYGIHRPGTAYRMDEVPIPLPEILPSDLPSDAEILMELLHRLSPECP
jgi:formylmethanofuran dehydrogenase subunit B